MLTTLILVLHFGFLAYLVVGGFLAWRWPRTVWLHGAAACWGFVVVVAQLTCPLTWAEDWSRRRAGEPGLSQGFIDRYIEGVVYPERHTAWAQAVVAVVVVGSWAVLMVRHPPAGAGARARRRRSRAAGAAGARTRAAKAGNPQSAPLP